MKPYNSGRFDKEKGFVGGTDLQNIASNAWPQYNTAERGFQVASQSVSVTSDQASEMSPKIP